MLRKRHKKAMPFILKEVNNFVEKAFVKKTCIYTENKEP